MTTAHNVSDFGRMKPMPIRRTAGTKIALASRGLKVVASVAGHDPARPASCRNQRAPPCKEPVRRYRVVIGNGGAWSLVSKRQLMCCSQNSCEHDKNADIRAWSTYRRLHMSNEFHLNPGRVARQWRFRKQRARTKENMSRRQWCKPKEVEKTLSPQSRKAIPPSRLPCRQRRRAPLRHRGRCRNPAPSAW